MWSGPHSYKRVEKLSWHINNIINISKETSTFPQNVNKAHVRPLLKKTSLPKNELKNYRHVSNLSFISKILEKIVANRLQAHIKNNHLSNPLQLAHRKDHSTKSAVLKVHNDIIISMDQGEVTALTLLDLSAAFDTIDHATLTHRLSDWYGRLKFGFLLICKIGTFCQITSHSHMSFHRVLC